MEIYWHISSHLFWMPSRGGLRGACRQPAGVPACNLMFNPQPRGGLGRVLKYLGEGGAGDKIFALTMGRSRSGVGEHPIAGVHISPYRAESDMGVRRPVGRIGDT